ncbi:hypothetical protein [Nocardia transvalensis]|uniref:hypothetical protein n=1 Tax=Nocardia transvalensis TaxID=37333 RepID=UPI0018956E71|nr:hypothetical protein [Nocardia transvalensis]MBF6330747.1 hypothetical protein [Nocardia transvalensis]
MAEVLEKRRVRRLQRHLWWLLSLLVSLLFAFGTLHSWLGASRHEVSDTVTGTPALDPQDVDKVVAEQWGSPDAVTRIPTGVLLLSMEFVNAYNVKMTGMVWQRFGPGFPADVTHGVMMPEADNPRALTPAFSFDDREYHIEVWAFSATFRQHMDYKNYPLDHQDVWIRMRPADLTRPAQLVPDFEAFPKWVPERLAGLDPGLVFGSWEPDYTAFSFDHREFGLKHNRAAYQAADLYFNVGINRSLVGPLIGRIVPVLLLALLMFLSLFVITTDPDRRNISGFTAFAIIGFAVSTVLVIAVNDNAARAETGSAGISYIEFWYFTLYAMTLLVAFNATMLITGGLRKLVAWRENMLPKLVFWPIFTGLMYVATLAFLGP